MSTQSYIHPNAIDVMGRLCLEDERGAYVPLSQIAPVDLLEDELVGKLLGFAKPLSAELARLKSKSFADVEAFLGLLAQDYNVERRTKKGNLTLYTYDRRRKVEIKSSDRIVFGAQLQMAKSKVDECLRKWGATIDPRLQAIINSAFDVDREGAVRPARILLLRRAHITDDPDWDQAMRAIDDAMRVVGTSFYMLFRERIGDTDNWIRISLDFANVELTPEAEAAFSARKELEHAEAVFGEIRDELSRSPSKFPDDVDLTTAVAWLVDQQYAKQGELEMLAQQVDEMQAQISEVDAQLVRLQPVCDTDGDIVGAVKWAVNYVVEDLADISRGKKNDADQLQRLFDHCRTFIEKQSITCADSVAQCDRVIENAYDFIAGIGEIVGWAKVDG